MTRSDPPDVTVATKAGQMPPKAAYSRLHQRLERRYADLWALLPQGIPPVSYTHLTLPTNVP
jgi:hypothetical protein